MQRIRGRHSALTLKWALTPGVRDAAPRVPAARTRLPPSARPGTPDTSQRHPSGGLRGRAHASRTSGRGAGKAPEAGRQGPPAWRGVRGGRRGQRGPYLLVIPAATPSISPQSAAVAGPSPLRHSGRVRRPRRSAAARWRAGRQQEGGGRGAGQRRRLGPRTTEGRCWLCRARAHAEGGAAREDTGPSSAPPPAASTPPVLSSVGTLAWSRSPPADRGPASTSIYASPRFRPCGSTAPPRLEYALGPAHAPPGLARPRTPGGWARRPSGEARYPSSLAAGLQTWTGPRSGVTASMCPWTAWPPAAGSGEHGGGDAASRRAHPAGARGHCRRGPLRAQRGSRLVPSWQTPPSVRTG